LTSPKSGKKGEFKTLFVCLSSPTQQHWLN